MTNHKKVSSSRRPWKVLAVAALALIAVSVAAYHGSSQPSGAGDGTGRPSYGGAVPPYYVDLHGIVLPKTLPPERFREDKVRYAYEVAAKIPETLAQLPCYCPCDRTVGHKSLLHCYADQHAAYCGICQDSALWAEKRVKEKA